MFTDNSSISQLTDQQLGERFENLTGRKAISMQNSNVNNIWIKCQCYQSPLEKNISFGDYNSGYASYKIFISHLVKDVKQVVAIETISFPLCPLKL